METETALQLTREQNIIGSHSSQDTNNHNATSQSSLPFRVLAWFGSPWFGSVLLLVILFALAGGTIYEVTDGSGPARARFYGAGWLGGVFALLLLSLLASIVTRFSNTKRGVSLLIAHLAIVFIAFGAYVTKFFGTQGQLTLHGSFPASRYSDGGTSLLVSEPSEGPTTEIPLPSRLFESYDAVESPNIPSLSHGDINIDVLHYVPHSEWRWSITDDGDEDLPAAQVSLDLAGRRHTKWLFAGDVVELGPLVAACVAPRDEEELRSLLGENAEGENGSIGKIELEINGQSYSVLAEDCLNKPYDIEGSDLTVEILRYFPHASVDAEFRLTNLSEEPINPAVRLRISSEHWAVVRRLFALHPVSPHERETPDFAKVKAKFVRSDSHIWRQIPILLALLPDGTSMARFRDGDSDEDETATEQLQLDSPVETPWPGCTMTMKQRLRRAKVEHRLESATPTDNVWTPAIQLRATRGEDSKTFWIRKYEQPGTPIILGNEQYRFKLADTMVSLGFTVTLDRFIMEPYPGEQSPRTYESFISVHYADGKTQQHHISMNKPATVGQYNLYQASYSVERQVKTSVLSVSNDPGRPIVFAGFVTLALAVFLALVLPRSQERLQSSEQEEEVTSGGLR